LFPQQVRRVVQVYRRRRSGRSDVRKHCAKLAIDC
jgi:hypothetical protein